MRGCKYVPNVDRWKNSGGLKGSSVSKNGLVRVRCGKVVRVWNGQEVNAINYIEATIVMEELARLGAPDEHALVAAARVPMADRALFVINCYGKNPANWMGRAAAPCTYSPAPPWPDCFVEALRVHGRTLSAEEPGLLPLPAGTARKNWLRKRADSPTILPGEAQCKRSAAFTCPRQM